MKLPCPSCAQALNLPDKLAGKLVTCPACQQKFAAPELPAAPAKQGLMARISGSHPAPPAAPPPSVDELALVAPEPEQGSTFRAADPTALEKCPYCGAEWKKGAVECKKCRYNCVVGKRMHRPYGSKFSLHLDVHKLFLYALAIAAIYGAYWFYNNWDRMRNTVSNGLDNATRTEPTAEDGATMIRKDSNKKLGRD